MTSASPSPRPWAVAGALLAVYLAWGATYLAIRFAVETLPPFGMAAARFLSAGAVLYAVVRARGAARPTAAQWRSATVVGALLLLGGNGAVVWAERTVPSGLAALMVSVVPLWMVLFEALRRGGEKPDARVILGLILGFAGLVLLVGPAAFTLRGALASPGLVALLIAPLSWGFGSVYSRRADLPASPFLATAMEMLAGGALLLAVGVMTGEGASFSHASVSTRSWMSLAYLAVFGSLVGFTAYVWLLSHASVALVSTYAYVNPVVAVVLAWAVAGETLTPRALAAAALIVAAVVMIAARRPAKYVPPAPADAPEAH